MQILLWLGGELYTCQLDPAGWWDSALPHPSGFCLLVLMINERAALKSLVIFVDLPILPFGSVSSASCINILKLCH